MDQAGGAPAHATAPLTGTKGTQATVAPISIQQAAAILKYTKYHQGLAITLGIVAAIIVGASTYSSWSFAASWLATLAVGFAVYLVSFGFALPYLWRPTITCQYCGKPVQALAARLPAVSWPRSCPHCLREITAS